MKLAIIPNHISQACEKNTHSSFWYGIKTKILSDSLEPCLPSLSQYGHGEVHPYTETTWTSQQKWEVSIPMKFTIVQEK